MGREGRGLQARERLVSISVRTSWLFLWKMSAHRIVSWWQSWGFRWILTPPFRISGGQAANRGFLPRLSASAPPTTFLNTPGGPSEQKRRLQHLLALPPPPPPRTHARTWRGGCPVRAPRPGSLSPALPPLFRALRLLGEGETLQPEPQPHH